MKEIATALVKAQKAFGPAIKNSTNPAYRSKYADLSACIDAVIGALNENNIMLMQHTHECNDGVIIETVFVHESGETLSAGRLHVPATKHDAQGYGSAMSYARRYSLMAACGISAEDDDGNAASRTKSRANPLDKVSDTAPRSEAVSAYPLRIPQQEEPVGVHQSIDAWVDAYSALMKRVEDSAKIPDPRDKMTKLREIKEANEAVLDKVDVAVKAKLTSDYQLRIRRLGAQQEK